MLGVIVLHYNNGEIGGGFSYASGSNLVIIMILESMFICAVNLYMLISGYFLCEKETRKPGKPLELLVQVMLFGLGFELLNILLKRSEFSVKGIFFSLVPDNYFVILYLVCFMVSPYVNILIKTLGKEKSRKMLFVLGGLFSLWPTIVDVFQEISGTQWLGLSSVGMLGSQSGYTIVNFLLMYCIGAYLKQYGRKDYKPAALWGLFLLMTAGITIWAEIENLGGAMGKTAWAYCSPLVIGEAVIIFLIFARLEMGSSRVVNLLARGSFTVYLLHSAFLPLIRIPEFVQAPLPLMILHILVSVCGIYLICFVCYLIYEVITRPIFRWLDQHMDLQV